jgi:hypothetical protein
MRSSRRYERHLPGYPSGVSKPSKPLERCAEVRTPPNRGPSGEAARLGGGRTGRALRARTPVSAWRGKTRPTGFASRRKRTNMRVGFIGLGMIGSCMRANLQKAGHQLIVHDLSGTRVTSIGTCRGPRPTVRRSICLPVSCRSMRAGAAGTTPCASKSGQRAGIGRVVVDQQAGQLRRAEVARRGHVVPAGGAWMVIYSQAIQEHL